MIKLSVETVYFLNFILFLIFFKFLDFLFPSILNTIFVHVGFIFLLIPLAWYSFKLTKRNLLNHRINTKNKAIFITGCDSGFGHMLARRFDSKGFKVFAGVLFPAGPGAQELHTHCSKRLTTVELDVTKEESVKKAYESVKFNLADSELWAIVNNAGIQKGFGVEFATLEDFKLCMEVNCLGVIRVTKTFLPLIKKSRGRIVNVTSMSGRIGFPRNIAYVTSMSGRIGFPRNIAYVTSKFAAVGFNDSLRHEMKVWGIDVISIEPDIFKTGIVQDFNAVIDALRMSLDKNVKEEYGDEYFEEYKEITKYFYDIASTNCHLVLDDIESAVCLKHPDVVYRPCDSFSRRLFYILYPSLPNDLANALMIFVNRRSPVPKCMKKDISYVI